MVAARARRRRPILKAAAAWSALGAWLPLLAAPDVAFLVAGLVALGSAAPLWVATWRPPAGWAAALFAATVRPAVAAVLLLAAPPGSWLLECWVFGELLLLPLLGWWLVGALWDQVEGAPEPPIGLQEALPEALQQGRWLVVLVRHAGCTFCRETLAGLAPHVEELRRRGFGVAVVHMGDGDSGERMGQRAGLVGVRLVSDPDRRLYRALALPRGTLARLFAPRIWLRGVQAGVFGRHWVGGLDGDGFQLGGAVLLEGGRPTVLHRSVDAADVEDWHAILRSCQAIENDRIPCQNG